MFITASHILVATHEQATELQHQISEGTDFSSLAQLHSSCPSRARGGDLGQFGPGAMVQEFDTAAFALEVQHVSEPVKTQFGWHLIKRTA